MGVIRAKLYNRERVMLPSAVYVLWASLTGDHASVRRGANTAISARYGLESAKAIVNLAIMSEFAISAILLKNNRRFCDFF